MSDKLIITGLVADCRIGVYDWEQQAPQPISIDLTLAIDAAQAAAKDDVQATVDYGRLVTSVKQLVERKAYRLLETLAEDVAAAVLKEFATPEVSLRVTKRALPGIDAAAVELTRPRRPAPRLP